MKKIKKWFIMLLCCLLISVIAMPVSTSAAKLNKKKLSLNVGKTYTLKASGIKGKIKWTSNKKKIASVSGKGLVTAKKKGTAVITAKYGKKKLTCKVTVKQPVRDIKLNQTSAALEVGKSLTLKATVSPSSANNKTVAWSSSNEKVATVTSQGVVKAVGKGAATITAKAKDGSKKKATCELTVKAATKDKLIMTPEQLSDALKHAGIEETYTLGKDIDLRDWSGADEQFVGILDGNGHKILNLKQRLLGVNSGTIKNIVFESCNYNIVAINDGMVKDVIFESCNIESKNGDAFAVAALNAGTISGCIVKGKLSVVEGGSVAAIAMNNMGRIDNCCNYATISGDGKYYDALGNEKNRSVSVAGITNSNDGIITNCVNYGSLNGEYAAGIAGTAYRKEIRNCLNVGEVNGTKESCGIVRSISNDTIIQNCVNVGKASYGIAKSVSGNVIDCYYLTSVSEMGAPESEYVRMIAVEKEDLTNTAAYPTLDFTKEWEMGTEYPIPRTQP